MSRRGMALRFSTRIGARNRPSRWSFTMAGHSARTTGTPRCCSFWRKGFRVVAHDRRGHGRSSQVSEGHDMDHYAADAAAVVDHLDLRNAVHIGHSTGGGEATRYVARHGRSRTSKLVLIGAVPPIMVKTERQPRRPADRGLRRPSEESRCQSQQVLHRSRSGAVLRIQSRRGRDGCQRSSRTGGARA